jgi:hypothetical protein
VWFVITADRVGRPKRRLPVSGFTAEWQTDADPCGMVARGGLAETDPAIEPPHGMQCRHVLKSRALPERVQSRHDRNEFALNLVILYEDALTREWTRELWARVDDLIGSGDICRKVWRICDLQRPAVFAEAVRAAAEAHVLVISFRDKGLFPPRFCDWAEAWVRHRSAEGAMVALIGVQPRPDATDGQARAYLESVARRGGLDFLPRERKLPKESTDRGRRKAIAPVRTLLQPA